ncbi:hypothetical protein [Persicobacter psychrovividus]|uniref:Chromosome segregation protein SMC n=1 Tax=Persicobacter psychrovividus TaxID=387638 RepID=A0ABM7VEM0_9BACT|nr:hypothetical protein PEPS_17160 [Persicobacter psychrovividus]
MDKQLLEENEELKTTVRSCRKRDKMQKKKTWIIMATVLLVAVALVTTYRFNEKNRVLRQNKMELKASYQALDSMNSLYQERIDEIKSLNGKADDLYRAKVKLETELDQLTEMMLLLDGKPIPMRQGQNLDPENPNQIQEAKYTPEERKELIDNALSSLKYKLLESKKQLAGYTQLLVEKDAEIVKLKKVNDQLLTENSTLKEKQNELSTNISDLKKEKSKLTEKLEVAAKIKAGTVLVEAINRRDKVYDAPFRLRHLDKLSITVTLEKNEVAKVQGHTVYLRILDDDQQVIMDPNGSSGEFKAVGENQIYTLSKEILFDNTGQNVNFVLPNHELFEKGKYTAELYLDDYTLKVVPFNIR